MDPRKRLEMTNKIKDIKKEQKEEDEVEIAMEVNNQNKLKQADRISKDNIKKKVFLEDNIYYTKKEEKAPKRLIHSRNRLKQINLKNKEAEFVKQTLMHPSERLKRNTRKSYMDDDAKYVGQFPSH